MGSSAVLGSHCIKSIQGRLRGQLLNLRLNSEDGGKIKVMRDDSVDDMIARVLGKRNARKVPEPTEDENVSSGRSTPAHLKDIVVNLPNDEDDQNETNHADKKS